MKIPQNLYLHSQSFNSKFIEFVWQFPIENKPTKQMVVKMNKDSTFYLEAGELLEDGEYIEGTVWSKQLLFGINDNVWNDPRYKHLGHDFFNNGDDLVSLNKEVIIYLKSI